MWNNLSISSLLDRITLFERSFDRARYFFKGSRTGGRQRASRPDAEIGGDECSGAETGIGFDASGCELDADDSDDDGEQAENSWLAPTSVTVDSVKGLYRKLWRDGAVDLAAVECTLSACSPRENLLLVEDADHYNLLHKAIILDSAPMIQVLLSHGCDVNWTSGGRRSCPESSAAACPHANVGALHLACYLGRRDVAEVLMRRGADKNARRRVSSSPALGCPDDVQPERLVGCRTSEKDEILASCGAREAVFFAVLGDQVDVVRLFVKDDSSCQYVDDMHLLHLACRIGARRCLEYFLAVCREAVNTLDTDGMPPMLLALKHGLRYVSLLLEAGCDVTTFNDLWERGANIYHFLFSALPIGDEDHVTLADILRAIGGRRLVDVNSKRESSGSAPLHELVHAVNRVPRGNGRYCDIDNSYLRSYDENVVEGVRFLLDHGADVYAKDMLGNSALATVLANRNHLARCALACHHDIPPSSRASLQTAGYGIDNVIAVAELLIGRMEPTSARSTYPVSVVLKTLCSVDNNSDELSLMGPFAVVERPGVMERYVRLLALVVRHFDPDRTPDGELPPLFYLLSQATLSPDADDYTYVVSPEHCRHLAAFAEVLLRSGASTEYELADTGGEALTYSSMDVLVYFLRKMQSYPLSRTAADLLSLGVLLGVVLKYGAQPYLYNVKFYHGPDVASSARVARVNRARNVDATCTCTFLYQYLCFGALNLQYVNAGEAYYDVLALVANATCQKLVYLAFQSARLVFTCMHGPAACECGMCLGFHAVLEGYVRAPRSLKQLCRLTIREHTCRLSPDRISCFHLPKTLADYILLIIV